MCFCFNAFCIFIYYACNEKHSLSSEASLIKYKSTLSYFISDFYAVAERSDEDIKPWMSDFGLPGIGKTILTKRSVKSNGAKFRVFINALFFVFLICHIYPPFTRKRCIAMFRTVSPHSLGSCHFLVTCLPHKDGASR